MAIAKIKKLEIIGLQKDREALLSLLQKIGTVELINLQAKDMGVVSLPEGVNLLEIAEAVSFLASFKEKTGFIRGMVKIKPLVYQEQLQQVIAGFDYQGMLKELYHLRNHLKTILQHKDRLIQEKQLLSPWQNLRLTLEELHYKQHCGIILGVLDRRDYSLLLEDCKEEKVNLFCEIVHRDRANMYLSILYIQEDFERLEMILKNYLKSLEVFLDIQDR